MKKYTPIDLHELNMNVFQEFGENWVALAAGGKKHANAMTISWGSLGVLWGKPTVTIHLRPERYTRGFVEKKGRFSINFLPRTEENHKALSYIGSVSGRDEDKLGKAGLSLTMVDKIPSLAEANLIMNCQVIYRAQFEPKKMLDETIAHDFYPDKDYHYTYIAEITNCYRVEDVPDEENAE